MAAEGAAQGRSRMWLTAIQASVIALQCTGVAHMPEQITTTASATDGFNTASGSATTTSRSRASAIVDLEIEGEIVRVRMPEVMSPTLGGRGQNGWRTLTDVTISEREITGRFAYNWINRPLVRVNRLTGTIDIQNTNSLTGNQGFQGRCERVQIEAPLF